MITVSHQEAGNPTTVLAMLDRMMAKRLRRAAGQLEHWLTERDRLIVEAHKTGASLREIAEHAQLSHVAVLKIVRRNEPHNRKEPT